MDFLFNKPIVYFVQQYDLTKGDTGEIMYHLFSDKKIAMKYCSSKHIHGPYLIHCENELGNLLCFGERNKEYYVVIHEYDEHEEIRFYDFIPEEELGMEIYGPYKIDNPEHFEKELIIPLKKYRHK